MQGPCSVYKNKYFCFALKVKERKKIALVKTVKAVCGVNLYLKLITVLILGLFFVLTCLYLTTS